MRPVILSWQMGSGRGHITALKRVAIALGPTFEIDAALSSMDHAAELAGLCKYIYPCQGLSLNSGARNRSVAGASWGQYLGDCGFDDVAKLAECFNWWHQTFKARNPALVVCDYAPVAQWTAQCMGIRVVSIGTAFGQPPAILTTFPQILPDHAGWHHDENRLVENVNLATTPLGFKTLERLPQLYDVNRQILMSFPALDPYAGFAAREQYVSPVPTLSRDMLEAGTGDEIFIYFSTTESRNLPLMEAVASLELPVRAYVPNITTDMAAALKNASAKILTSAASAVDIKRRSRMMLHSGQHGTLSLGMALGLPQFAVPQQLEQLFNGRRAAELGVLAMPDHTGISADAFRECIRAAYFNDTLARNARSVQRDIQSALPENATVELRQALNPFLPNAFSL